MLQFLHFNLETVMLTFFLKVNKLKRRFLPPPLFDGNDELFKRLLVSSSKYAEYGCGQSTIWVAENTKASIHSVDSNNDWINFCQKELGKRKATLQWVDCGVLGNWGRPLNYEKRNNFSTYAQSIWNDDTPPDVVLIDGRFRVLCFLISLKYATEGTRIIFDDYINRPNYHIVEEFISRFEICGRQCLFIAPAKDSIDIELLDKMISKFEYVME